MQRGVEPRRKCQAGWLTFTVSLFLKDWVIRHGDCDCATNAAGMSEQVWEQAPKHTTPCRRHRPTAERGKGLFTKDEGTRSHKVSPKDAEDGALKPCSPQGGRSRYSADWRTGNEQIV